MGAGRRKFLGPRSHLRGRDWDEVAGEVQDHIRMAVDAMAQSADWILDPEGRFSFVRPLTAPLLIGGETPIQGAIGDGTLQIEGFDATASLLLHETFNSSETRAGIEILKRRDEIWTALSAGDEIGGITWSGADGAKASIAATIHVDVLGTPSADKVPGNIVFSTESTAGTLAQRVEINQSGLRIFHVDAAGEGGEITFEAATGFTDTLAIDSFQDTLRFLSDGVGGGLMAFFDSSGHFKPGAANTFDLGSTALPWHDINVAAAVTFQERVAPGNAPANMAYVYADDSGGKTRIMAIFSSGVAQVMATQP